MDLSQFVECVDPQIIEICRSLDRTYLNQCKMISLPVDSLGHFIEDQLDSLAAIQQLLASDATAEREAQVTKRTSDMMKCVKGYPSKQLVDLVLTYKKDLLEHTKKLLDMLETQRKSLIDLRRMNLILAGVYAPSGGWTPRPDSGLNSGPGTEQDRAQLLTKMKQHLEEMRTTNAMLQPDSEHDDDVNVTDDVTDE